MKQKKTKSYILELRDINRTMALLAGGKGASLGELTGIADIRVPEGFCISTDAFKDIIAVNHDIQALSNHLAVLTPEDRDAIIEASSALRQAIEAVPIPAYIKEALQHHLGRSDKNTAWAVRSSATAEDLPDASFAGQQDTYLNIIGTENIMKHIARCWASLFTERAVIYRLRNGFDSSKLSIAVVIQKMVFPDAAGILFTADPVSGNRKTTTIDAGFGLGEALVSAIVDADQYKIYKGNITDKRIADKKKIVYAPKEGGIEERELAETYRYRQVLTDAQALQLEHIGRRIEAHFGYPQDIEWCMVKNKFYIVQSRPITTLYPIPETKMPGNRVYLSVGHQQMMTDPIKPLGLSIWQMTASAPMHTAGGRLFVDITDQLTSPAEGRMMIDVVGKSDPLIKDALLDLLDRGSFIQPAIEHSREHHSGKNSPGRSFAAFQTQIDYDPSIVPELIQSSREAIALLQQDISTKSGAELFGFIEEDIQRLRQKTSDPRSFAVFMTAMNASAWINEKMQEWLGEINAADILAQSVPNNVTSEMGLALLDVADSIRPYPQLIAFLQGVREDSFLDHMEHLDGGGTAREAITAFLRRYGMRCAGEIDITRPRWSEQPAILIPVILNNIKNFEYGSGRLRFEKGLEEALQKEQELLGRLMQLPDGAQKAGETREMIERLRNFIGYREYPKYHIISRYFIYKQALLKEAERLLQAGIIPEREAIYYLDFEELRKAVHDRAVVDQELINQRKIAHQTYKKLRPPRVLTSDGESVAGSYRRDKLPAGAIAGLPVSSGITEGRARVILDMKEASLEPGDILVTAFTDPSWTPLFVSVKGLVTEVGGLMTHGAVIAREYGLPAVVGVDNATRLIKDGQRIRVNGTEGYIEIIE